LATVLGQDLEQADDGVFHIARRVAKDRVISTVDLQARPGHKTAARGFDGYKGHVAVDPDSVPTAHLVVMPSRQSARDPYARPGLTLGRPGSPRRHLRGPARAWRTSWIGA
jgi:hypothetical protein